MSVLAQLASALGRRDEVPNQELAKVLATTQNSLAISELVENLSNKDKAIQSDCIKVLYEIGYINPALIAPHVQAFVKLLGNKQNRLVWGAMIALDVAAGVNPDEVHRYLPEIIRTADSGSVITRDHAVGVLIHLMRKAEYADDCFALLLEQLSGCPTNQLPMYAENALPVITAKYRSGFIQTLSVRLPEIEKDSKRARVEKVIRKAGK